MKITNMANNKKITKYNNKHNNNINNKMTLITIYYNGGMVTTRIFQSVCLSLPCGTN